MLHYLLPKLKNSVLNFLIYKTVFKCHCHIVTSKMALSPRDPSSFSRPELCILTSINLDLEVDFEAKILKGSIVLSAKKVDEKVEEIVLDMKDLKISKVFDPNTNKNLCFVITDTKDVFGSKLTIQLPERNDNKYDICINYATSPNASGLQWLTALQTGGKKHPFMFSQFQPIHARSALPCQDTPAVKVPYTAKILVPQGLVALMSAKRTSATGTTYHFHQDIPIASYLMAIAVGDLESRQLGPRCHVWAEKPIVEAAAYEFAETENQLKCAEEICGPYLWGIYDLLVLPPSFSYGGMENPCLTFVTPTLLAGDRSLVFVVAHEISHSWTGNLVTNRNFEHFWLNEGFTVFIERKIKGRMHNAKEQDFDAMVNLGKLQETINDLGKNNPLTCLVVDLNGVHPDDAFSLVPYEKGQTFLRYLETTVGGPEKFEPFLREYFDTFKFKSIDTNDFKQFFEKHFGNLNIDWDSWLYTPGMPPILPDYDTSLSEACMEFKKLWLEWDDTSEPIPFTEESFNNFSTNQKVFTLQEILESPPQKISKLQKIEELFKLNEVKNSEIKFLWLRIGLKAEWEEKIPIVLDWVNEVGRMKFVRPLYRDLYKWEVSRQEAIDNYNANKKYMMHATAFGVGRDLHLRE